MDTLYLGGTPTPVIWRRHARARRITLRIDPGQGCVVVTLPPGAARSAGRALLAKNAGWLASRIAALPDIPPLANGASVAIDGIERLIQHAPQLHGAARLEKNIIQVPGEPDRLPRLVREFLRAEARRRLAAQAVAKAACAGLALQRISVRDTRSRWGSCSPRGALMFCWRLVMAPPFVQDYVVAHEVAHLRHLDHGPDFWALADSLSPHRQPAVTWLQAEGPRLLRVA